MAQPERRGHPAWRAVAAQVAGAIAARSSPGAIAAAALLVCNRDLRSVIND